VPILKTTIFVLLLLPSVVMAQPIGQTIELGPLQTMNSAPYVIPANNTKNTLIQVWASWCPFCKKTNAYLEKLHKEIPPNSLNIITISMDQNPLLAKQYMENNKYTFPAAMMTPELHKSMGKVKGIPILIILDKDNKVIYREVGEIFPEDYERLKRFAKR
jgi:thiol-disulfide isomerase/thioredoxin